MTRIMNSAFIPIDQPRSGDRSLAPGECGESREHRTPLHGMFRRFPLTDSALRYCRLVRLKSQAIPVQIVYHRFFGELSEIDTWKSNILGGSPPPHVDALNSRRGLEASFHPKASCGDLNKSTIRFRPNGFLAPCEVRHSFRNQRSDSSTHSLLHFDSISGRRDRRVERAPDRGLGAVNVRHHKFSQRQRLWIDEISDYR